MFRRKNLNVMDGAEPLVAVKTDDGEELQLPLPEKTCICPGALGAGAGGRIETVITLDFGNVRARYLVIGASDDGQMLVGKLVQQNATRLAPLILPDPETMIGGE